MQLESLLKTLSILEEGISLRSVKAAIEYEPNAARRYVILSKLARANNLPGLFDPADGTFVNVNGQPERSVSDEIVRQLGDACLVPEIAKTNMFGLFGADEVKQDAVSKSFWCNWNIYVDERIKRLYDLIKIITPNKFNESKKSLSDILYETFFDLDEETTTKTPKFAKEIQELGNIIEELTELNSRFEKYSGKPDKKILEAIARARAALKAAEQEEANRPETFPIITPQIVRPPIIVRPNMPPEVVPAVTPPAPAPETETEEDRRRRRDRIQELIDKARKKKEEETPPSPNPTPTPPPNSVDVQPSKPVSWKEIYKLNKDQIKNPNLIYPGQKLKMPNGKKDYEVKQGDSLSKIAARTDLAESRLNSDDQILAIIKGVIY